MADHTAANRALCCSPTCKRGTDATGACVAAIYGAGIRQRAEAAGWWLAPAEPTEAMLSALQSYAVCSGFLEEGYRAMRAAAGAPNG